MMTISDIIEIIVVCALIFSRWAIWRGTLCDAFATPYVCSFAKPRYVKPAGTLRRTEKARATKK